jgi:putative protease
MKTALYVATVARTYRKAIDDYLESEEKYRANMPWYQDEIARCTYRQFTTGFYFGKPSDESQIYDSNTYVNEYTYLGIVDSINDKGLARLEQRNKFSVGETIEIMKPDGRDIETLVKAIYAEDGTWQESAPHPQQLIDIELETVPEAGDILRIHAPQNGNLR